MRVQQEREVNKCFCVMLSAGVVVMHAVSLAIALATWASSIVCRVDLSIPAREDGSRWANNSCWVDAGPAPDANFLCIKHGDHCDMADIFSWALVCGCLTVPAIVIWTMLVRWRLERQS